MASEPKTKPTDVPVADFIAAVPHAGRRADAEVVDAMLHAISGEPAVMWGPSIIGYGVYNGATGPWPRLGFSPRKANMVVYLVPGFEDRTDLMQRLGKHRIGVSCLYLNRIADVDQDVLRELVQLSWDEMLKRYPRD